MEFQLQHHPSSDYLGLTGCISLQSKGLSRVFSNTTVQKHQFINTLLSSQSDSHPYMTTGKTIALAIWTFVSKVMSLLFNMQSRFFIAFLPRSKPLLISWLQSPTAVILEPQNIKSVTVSIVSPSVCHEVMELDVMILVVLKLNIQKTKIMASGTITSWQIDRETVETVTDFIFLGSKITADGDCSHENKRHLFLGRKAMTNLDSILKSREITLPTKVHMVTIGSKLWFSSSHVWM